MLNVCHMSIIAQQYVQLSLLICQLQIGAYQHSYDNYQFDTKLKSFCNWGRLNISFFTFATLKIRHSPDQQKRLLQK